MHYSFLIYSQDGIFERLPPEKQEEVLAAHRELQALLSARGPFAAARLTPVSNAVTLRPTSEMGEKALVTDGPFAETKERFMGLYVAEFGSLEEAIEAVQTIASPYVTLEVRPVYWTGGLLNG